jgi:hypothetical protein
MIGGRIRVAVRGIHLALRRRRLRGGAGCRGRNSRGRGGEEVGRCTRLPPYHPGSYTRKESKAPGSQSRPRGRAALVQEEGPGPTQPQAHQASISTPQTRGTPSTLRNHINISTEIPISILRFWRVSPLRTIVMWEVGWGGRGDDFTFVSFLRFFFGLDLFDCRYTLHKCWRLL